MALKGIKVLELAGLAPAPFCGMVLADFGATVLRIDKIGANTDLDCLANGKQSIALDLKKPESVKIIKALCKQSDVLIEPYRKGVMEKLGIGPDVLLKQNPKLIYARLTGYGQTGPYSSRAGHDINYVALSGLLSFFGRSNENPLPPVNLAADFGGGGLMCALGILLALIERNKSSKGQIIDCSMVEGTAYLGSWLFRSQTMPLWGKERGRNFLDTGAHFYEVYETKDKRYMSVGALDPQFYDKLLEGLELDPNEVPHLQDFDKSKVLLKKIFKQRTRDEWCRIFDDVDACVAPVLGADEVMNHYHNSERKSFFTNDGVTIPKPAPRLSRTPGESNSCLPPPQLGEHTFTILSNLGYSEKEIHQLVGDGVVECFNKSKL